MTQIIWPVRSSCFGSWRRRETKNGRRTDGEYLGQQGRALHDKYATGVPGTVRSHVWVAEIEKLWDDLEADCTPNGLLKVMMMSRKVRQSFRKQLINGEISLPSSKKECDLFEKVLIDLYRGALHYKGAPGVKLFRYWPASKAGEKMKFFLGWAKARAEYVVFQSSCSFTGKSTAAVKML
jgi:hypothetical protein